MKVGLPLAVTLALSATLAPAEAGSLVDRAPAQTMAFANHAGYVAGTIPHCGGDAAEIDYFKGLIRKMLLGNGASESDLAVVLAEMDRVSGAVAIRARDCVDEGGMELAAELQRRLGAIRSAE